MDETPVSYLEFQNSILSWLKRPKNGRRLTAFKKAVGAAFVNLSAELKKPGGVLCSQLEALQIVGVPADLSNYISGIKSDGSGQAELAVALYYLSKRDLEYGKGFLEPIESVFVRSGKFPDDFPFEMRTGIARRSPAAAIAVGSQAPQPILADANSRSDIFSYGYNEKGKIKVLARDTEQAALRRFLSGDQRFLWLQLAGGAGQGKSRLAWELILHARDKLGFSAGFIDSKALKAFEGSWATWQPDKPHLIVIDYVTELEGRLGEIIALIIKRASEFRHRVRLLVIDRQRRDRGRIVEVERNTLSVDLSERQPEPRLKLTEAENAAWFDRLVKEAKNFSREVVIDGKEVLFERHGVIELHNLEDEALIDITRQVSKTRNKSTSRYYSDEFLLDNLKRFDSSGRPLYAYFLGIALEDGRFSNSWGRSDLLSYVLNSDYEKRWGKFFGGHAPSLGTDIPAFRLAVLATILRVIDRFNVQQPLDQEGQLSDRDFEQALVLVNGPLGHGVEGPGDIVPGLLPDILGEWFVLSVFRKQQKLIHRVMQYAWRQDANATAGFLLRLSQDFPDDPVTHALLEIHPEAKEDYHVYSKVALSILGVLAGNQGQAPPDSLVNAVQHSSSQGDAKATNMLGFLYWKGFGFEKNLSQALSCFEKCIEDQNADAMANIAALFCEEFYYGVGPEIAFQRAFKAAQLGNANGHYYLAICYSRGYGILKDSEEALRHFYFSAQLGHMESTYRVSDLYSVRDILIKDDATAISWCMKAASMGHLGASANLRSNCIDFDFDPTTLYSSSVDKIEKELDRHPNALRMTDLAMRLLFGVCTSKDVEKATHWLSKASEMGDQIASNYLSAIISSDIGKLKNSSWNKEVDYFVIFDNSLLWPDSLLSRDWDLLDRNKKTDDIITRVLMALDYNGFEDIQERLLVVGARSLDLKFYPEWELVEIATRCRKSAELSFYSALITKDGAIVLDGTLPTLRVVNGLNFLCPTEENLSEYCSFLIYYFDKLRRISSVNDIVPYLDGDQLEKTRRYLSSKLYKLREAIGYLGHNRLFYFDVMLDYGTSFGVLRVGIKLNGDIYSCFPEIHVSKRDDVAF